MHEDTFFKVNGQCDVVRTTLGSRPGDCFADVIFSYLWGRILHDLQQALRNLGLAEEIPVAAGLQAPGALNPTPEAHQGFLGPTWMDDTCICVSDADVGRLEQKISQSTGHLLALCETHGLSPNLQPGKSEILLALHVCWKLRLFKSRRFSKMPVQVVHDLWREAQAHSHISH